MDAAKPTRDLILVKQVEPQDLKVGGIVIPEIGRQVPPVGKVEAVGEKVSDVTVGDTVLWSKQSGTSVKINKEPRLILREQDVLAILG